MSSPLADLSNESRQLLTKLKAATGLYYSGAYTGLVLCHEVEKAAATFQARLEAIEAAVKSQTGSAPSAAQRPECGRAAGGGQPRFEVRS